MAVYRISGVWKDADRVITHYAVHTVTEKSATRASKKTKAQAIALLEIQGNSATTWIWSYIQTRWTVGQNVQVVNDPSGKYLRSDPDNKLTDNLGHLINFDWITL